MDKKDYFKLIKNHPLFTKIIENSFNINENDNKEVLNFIINDPSTKLLLKDILNNEKIESILDDIKEEYDNGHGLMFNEILGLAEEEEKELNEILKEPIGFRKPDSKMGSWTGAFVAMKSGKLVTAGFFENNSDFIGNPSLKELKKTIMQLKNEGWLEMGLMDIKLTSGF